MTAATSPMRVSRSGSAPGRSDMPVPALVEPDQAREGAEPVQEVRVPPFGPVEHQVRDEAGDQHEVDVAGAGDLVGDVEVVAAACSGSATRLVGDRGSVRPRPARRPRRRSDAASSASSRRLATSSLRSSDDTWLSTVRTEMTRRRAICGVASGASPTRRQHLGLAIGDAGLRQRPRLRHPTIVEPRASVVNPWWIRGRPRMPTTRPPRATVDAVRASMLTRQNGDPHHDHDRHPDAQRRRHRHALRHPRRGEGEPGDREVPVPRDQPLGQRHPQPVHDPRLLRRRPGAGAPAGRRRTTPTTPRSWSGEDNGPTPVEFLLHALAACLTSGIANIAAVRGVNLTSVESTVEGDIDLLGILGLSDEVRNGYQQIRVSFHLEGDDADKLRGVVERSRLRSAVYDVLTHGVPVSIDVTTG